MSCPTKAASGVRIMNAERQHARYPTTFQIPDRTARTGRPPGHLVKLAFRRKGSGGERMWVKVTETTARGCYEGVLQNSPVVMPMKHGDPVKFGPEHIIDVPAGGGAGMSAEAILATGAVGLAAVVGAIWAIRRYRDDAA